MAATHTAPRAASSASDGWQRVDAALDELERLTAANLGDDAFYAGLFERLSGLGFASAAVWSAEGLVGVRIERHSAGSGSAETGQAAVLAAIQAGEAKVVLTKGGQSIVAPWKTADTSRGALQVWLEDGISSAASEGYLRLATAISEILGAYRNRREKELLRQQLAQRDKLDVFGQSLHESPELADVAYRIANDGRALVGCERMAIAIRRGRRYQVLAVSGAEHIHRRAESMQQLQRLCQAVAATGLPLISDGSQQELPPQIEEALGDYLDISPALALAAIPLMPPAQGEPSQADQRPIGILVCENYKQPFEPDTRDLMQGVLPHCRLALASALRMDSIPGHRFWLAIGREGRLSRWTVRAIVLVIALAAIVGALIAIPANLQVKSRGELQPVVRHEVFAPRDGVVTAIQVDHGDVVKAGDPLLEMRSPELDLELQGVVGELETVRKQLAAAQSERLQIRPGEPDSRLKERRLTADEQQYQEQVRGLTQRQELLQKQRDELTVHSPAAGEVVTWNARQRLASRPLRRGDALLTIADPAGPWQLELRVPSRRAGRILRARGAAGPQNVSFMLATNPGVTLTGTVEHIAERVEIDDAGEAYLLVTVSVPAEAPIERVPGAAAVGRIDCGRTSLAEAWFYEAWDAARLWLPF